MPKLSIIVPVYNVEKYLPRCIDSILAQTFTDFEVILIDDGSPDGCGKIIDEYAKKDNRIIPIHQVNKGVSAARNAGLKIARGEYLGFVDPDDWTEPDMYESLIDSLESQQCDIACCLWMNDFEDGTSSTHPNALPTQIMDGETFARHLFDMPPTIAGSTWNKLFRKELINKEFNPDYAICEDIGFVAAYCVNVRKAVYIDKALYHVFSRPESATRKLPERVALGLPVRREIIGIMRNVNKDCQMMAEKVFLDQCITFCSRGKEKSSEYYQLAKRELLTYMHHNNKRVLSNRHISWKMKLLLISEILRLKNEKGEQFV